MEKYENKERKNMDTQILKQVEEEFPGWEIPLYASYDDRISSRQLADIIEAEDPEETFKRTIMQQWEDAVDYCIWEAAKTIASRLEEDPSEIAEIIRDKTEAGYPLDHYMKQTYKVPVMLNTGDGNSDFTLNDIGPGVKPDERASVIWLVKQQGHTVEELEAAMSDETGSDKDSFISSVWQEIEECPSGMSVVTFLVEMTAEDILRINAAMKKKDPAGKVVLKNTTMCGLFAPWSGAGSLLEIGLEKDVEIPVEYIWSCTPDLPRSRTGWWYGVDETYGLVGSAWTRGGIKKICI